MFQQSEDVIYGLKNDKKFLIRAYKIFLNTTYQMIKENEKKYYPELYQRIKSEFFSMCDEFNNSLKNKKIDYESIKIDIFYNMTKNHLLCQWLFFDQKFYKIPSITTLKKLKDYLDIHCFNWSAKKINKSDFLIIIENIEFDQFDSVVME